MPDKINIPIVVTGAEAAKAEIGQVAAAARQASEATKGGKPADSAPGAAALIETEAQAKLTSQTEKAAAGKRLLSREARAMGATILNTVNPALGGMFMLLDRMIEGLGRASWALFGIAGAGAALGGIVVLFEKFAKAAQEAALRAKEAREAAVAYQQVMMGEREKGIRERIEIEGALGPQGLIGKSRDVQRRGAQLAGDLGIPAEMATSAALAEAISTGRGRAFDAATFAAGLLARGGKPLSWGEKPGEALLAIAETTAAGQRAGGAEALQRFRTAVGGQARPFVPVPEAQGEGVTARDVAIANFRAAHPEVTDEQIKRLLDYLLAPPPVRGAGMLRLTALAGPAVLAPEMPPNEALPGLGWAIEDIRYRQAREEWWREQNRNAQPPTQPPTQPVTIINNTYNNQRAMNVDSMFNQFPGQDFGLRSLDAALDGGAID